MIKRFVVAAASLFGVTACAPIQQFIVVGGDADTRFVSVTAVDGEVEIYVRNIGEKKRLVVNVEPAIPEPDSTPRMTKIKFRLQQGYQFASPGIEICPATPASKACKELPDPRNPCQASGSSGRVITCKYRTPTTPDTIYTYTITAIDQATGRRLELDPSIWN